MKVCAISDLHGKLIDIKPCDVLLICGDISPLKYQRSVPLMIDWLYDEFTNWVNSLPCEYVIFVAGNHDKILSVTQKEAIAYKLKELTHGKAIYLEDNYYDYLSDEGKIYRIYGTPACHIFGNWYFMYSDEKLAEIYSKIPENCDILLTHDAPFGVSDVLLQEAYYTGEHIGNKPLAQAIKDKTPTIVLHGHLHSTSREFEELGQSKVANCSIVDERYQVVYEPLYLDLNK